jgi:hypothetical protein
MDEDILERCRHPPFFYQMGCKHQLISHPRKNSLYAQEKTTATTLIMLSDVQSRAFLVCNLDLLYFIVLICTIQKN